MSQAKQYIILHIPTGLWVQEVSEKDCMNKFNVFLGTVPNPYTQYFAEHLDKVKNVIYCGQAKELCTLDIMKSFDVAEFELVEYNDEM